MKLFSDVYAQTGMNSDGSDLGCSEADYLPLNSLSQLIVDVSKVLLPLGILILFVMLIVGGVKYLTSGGDMKALASAKGTITFALIGVVLLVSAYVILMLIGNILLGDGTEIFNFQLDEIIKLLSSNSGGSINPCLIGPTP